MYAPGCPHIFDGWNYTKWNYDVMIPIINISLSKNVYRSVVPGKAWPNAGMLHVFNSKQYLYPEDNVVCWIEVCDHSLREYEWRRSLPLRERLEY